VVRVLADSALEKAVLAAGCEFAPFVHAPRHHMSDREADLVQDWRVRDPLRQLLRVTDKVMFGPALGYARDVLAESERFGPDALALDYMLFGAHIAAEKLGLPTASLVHTPWPLPTDGVPPFGMGLRPARGPLGRLGERALRRAMVWIFERQGRPVVNAARAELGLAPLGSVFDQLWRSDRLLVLTSSGYDFAARASLPPQVVYVGPQLDDPSWTEPFPLPWPSSERPLVLVSLGTTFQDQAALIQRVIDALATLPVRGLVTLGGVFSAADFRAPDHVVAVASAPHQQILPQARAVIAHGGHGTTLKALAHGVPVLSLPLGRDQADNAVRVVEAGAGLTLPARAGTRALAEAVDRLLHEPRFAAGARRLAEQIAREVEADRAISELEGLARG
jgi:UDP:flavonoid glycosyltransferase YjiC (YdhE family)